MARRRAATREPRCEGEQSAVLAPEPHARSRLRHAPGLRPLGETRKGAAPRTACAQIKRRCAAHWLSSRRFESCSLRSTAEAWDSTVLIEIESRLAISL